MAQKTRREVAERLAAYYSKKFSQPNKPAAVQCYYDESKRAYCIQGESLPAHPDLTDRYPNGWSLLDHIKPAKARRLTA